jgi:putative membrane protein
MMLEAALAYVHLAAILSWVVFVSSTAALARIEWLNPAVVNRLVVVDRIAFMAGGAVLAAAVGKAGALCRDGRGRTAHSA